MAKNYRELEELLESDDEFPMTFDEIPDIPAYQDNDRFCSNGMECETSDDEDDYCSSSPTLRETIEKIKNDKHSKTEINKEEKHIQKGVLNKQDILCLSSISNVTTKTMLLWFLNFLLHKDMQSKFKFLRSCLVNDIVTSHSDYAIIDTSEKTDLDKELQHYEIVCIK